MLYHAFDFQNDILSPFRIWAGLTKRVLDFGMSSDKQGHFKDWFRQAGAGLDVFDQLQLTHKRPPFGITRVQDGNRIVDVEEEVVLDLPFGSLLRFKKDIKTKQPKVLMIAPLSGHFATLLRDTAKTMAQDHDVYITDWKNARDAPLSRGGFGMDSYIDYVIRFMEEIGPGAHMVAVCQPCVQALAAAAVMAEDDNPAAPLSMTLMAGPIDCRESPTTVNELATTRSISWFKTNMLATVPLRYPGAGRRVYPGFMQLTAFMSMNLSRHQETFANLFKDLSDGEMAAARKTKAFYEEYFAVLDLPAEFYIETVQRVFQEFELAKGEFKFRGRTVNPAAVRKTALMTVEGGRDDICAIGQTAAAHELCSSLRPHLKRHHLQANVGHYGVFSGRRWQNEIYPNVREFILESE